MVFFYRARVNIVNTFLDKMVRRRAFAKFQHVLKVIGFFIFLALDNAIYHAETPANIFCRTQQRYLFVFYCVT